MDPVTTKDTLLDTMNYWLYNIKKFDNIKPSTFECYDTTFRLYISSHKIALNYVKDITSIKVQNYYIEMKNEGFSCATIKKVHKLLSSFFKYAVTNNLISQSPLVGVTVPTEYKEDTIQYYSAAEVQLIKEKIKGDELEKIVLFAIGTGMRQGELLGLKYRDINFTEKYLEVKRTFNWNNKTFWLPKTKSSKRVIPVPDNLIKIIENKNTDELVFSLNGEPYSPKRLQKKWRIFCKKNSVPIKPFHSFRHTFATLLYTNGVELLTISKLLGHSSVKTTEIYSHIIPQIKYNAMNIINKIL